MDLICLPGYGDSDDGHAGPVAEAVAEVTPKYSSGRVEDCREGTDDGQEVVVADELLPVGLKSRR